MSYSIIPTSSQKNICLSKILWFPPHFINFFTHERAMHFTLHFIICQITWKMQNIKLQRYEQ